MHNSDKSPAKTQEFQFSTTTLSGFPIEITPGDIIFLIGDLGAGKTTLVKELLARYSIQPDSVRSPTYTYMQEYQGKDGSGTKITFHHFDLYRLNDYDDFLNIGGQEYVENPNSVKIIEWPEVIQCHVFPTKKITITSDGDRRNYMVDIF